MGQVAVIGIGIGTALGIGKVANDQSREEHNEPAPQQIIYENEPDFTDYRRKLDQYSKDYSNYVQQYNDLEKQGACVYESNYDASLQAVQTKQYDLRKNIEQLEAEISEMGQDTQKFKSETEILKQKIVAVENEISTRKNTLDYLLKEQLATTENNPEEQLLNEQLAMLEEISDLVSLSDQLEQDITITKANDTEVIGDVIATEEELF